MPWQRNTTNANKNRLENRGMAAELQHNLDKNFDVQGVEETSFVLSSILKPGIEDIKDLTKNYGCLWRYKRCWLNETMACHKFGPLYRCTVKLIY